MRMSVMLVSLLAGLLAHLEAAASPPNIVWIIADDMSPDIASLGVAGVAKYF